MQEAGLAVELLETRHVPHAFKTMPVKTDRKDARGIAQLMRLGWFRSGALQVDAGAGDARAADGAQAGADQAAGCRERVCAAILRGFGLKVGETTADAALRSGSGSWWRAKRIWR